MRALPEQKLDPRIKNVWRINDAIWVILGFACCFVPFALILPHFFGLTGVQLCQAASDLCAFILSICVTVPIVQRLSEGKNPHDAI